MPTYRSATIGGSIDPDTAQRKVSGQTPDVRFLLSSAPSEAWTAEDDYALKHKGVKLQKEYKDIYGRPIKYIISGTGSSTLIDTDGDVFHKSAIDAMARDSVGLNVLLNHNPEVPKNLAGTVLETRVEFMTTHDGQEIACLKLVSDVNKRSTRAWDTYELIVGTDGPPRRLGYSVGCLYTDAKPRVKNGRQKGADVFEVLPVEFSIVSMPANRMAWIDSIAVDLQEKGIIPRTEAFRYKSAALRSYAESAPLLERVENWMEFGPVDGPKLEQLAAYFEQKYGIVYAKPRSF